MHQKGSSIGRISDYQKFKIMVDIHNGSRYLQQLQCNIETSVVSIDDIGSC